jgi:adenosyl cobinamide kinase/adenosyl cobinamide phosphate guanylyltransferase
MNIIEFIHLAPITPFHSNWQARLPKREQRIKEQWQQIEKFRVARKVMQCRFIRVSLSLLTVLDTFVR